MTYYNSRGHKKLFLSFFRALTALASQRILTKLGSIIPSVQQISRVNWLLLIHRQCDGLVGESSFWDSMVVEKSSNPGFLGKDECYFCHMLSVKKHICFGDVGVFIINIIWLATPNQLRSFACHVVWKMDISTAPLLVMVRTTRLSNCRFFPGKSLTVVIRLILPRLVIQSTLSYVFSVQINHFLEATKILRAFFLPRCSFPKKNN